MICGIANRLATRGFRVSRYGSEIGFNAASKPAVETGLTSDGQWGALQCRTAIAATASATELPDTAHEFVRSAARDSIRAIHDPWTECRSRLTAHKRYTQKLPVPSALP